MNNNGYWCFLYLLLVAAGYVWLLVATAIDMVTEADAYSLYLNLATVHEDVTVVCWKVVLDILG